jgi:2-desacetyl-2-hydroxyethyl bacteriochlorophyllide A dehydrogenase
VIGAGPIGLGVIQFARVAGAQVIAMDVDENRLEFARRQFDVRRTIRAGDPGVDPHEQLKALTGGNFPTAVFDATGVPQSMNKAFDFAAHGGRVVFVGLCQGDVTFHDPDFHRKELTLLATRNSTPDDFRGIITLMETGRIDTKPWITHRVPFAETVEQFPTWLRPESKVIKAMVSL